MSFFTWRLDPRTRIAVWVLTTTAVIITVRPHVLMVESGCILLAVAALGLFEKWISSLRLILPVTVFVFVVSAVFFGIEEAAFLGVRLIDLLTLSFALFQKVSVEEIGESVRRMGLPYGVSFILTSSMRYVPLLGERLTAIMDAQKSRGIDLRARLKNVPNFLALVIPLLIQAILLSDHLAMAMEARGFGRKERTFRKVMRIGATDWAVMVSSAVLFSLFVAWELPCYLGAR
jgi:energy-coupling factor transport system permease protein